MKYIKLMFLAFKYLLRYKRRYLFLFLALSFGFTIVTLITSIKDDMYENVYKAAQDHYAGDIVAVGYDPNSAPHFHLTEKEADAVYAAAVSAQINPVHTVRRTIFGDEGIIYFNGTAGRLKYVVGADWKNETAYFNSLNYQNVFDVSKAGDDTVVLSSPVAEKLGVQPGDSIIIEVNTLQGQKNTGRFIVAGIIRDSSIFGYYKVYISRLTLNRLRLYDDGDCSMVGLYLANRKDVEQNRGILHNELSRYAATGPLVKDRNELLIKASDVSENTKIFIISLPVYLTEVADLLSAMNIVTYFLYGMMLLIILVSAMVTYRLLLHERAREIGTMRAIGFQERDIRLILILETFGLSFISIISGFLFTLVFSWGASFISFAWFPSFEIFLKNGKLHSLYLPKTMIINVIAILMMMFLAVWIPAHRSSGHPLPKLLSGGNA